MMGMMGRSRHENHYVWASIAMAALLVMTVTSAVARRTRRPATYLIHAYLDSAPENAKTIDRFDITASGKSTRWLLVVSYRAPGPVSPSGYLSRSLKHPWAINGKREDVARLFGAPAGTEIKGTFLVYTSGAPVLMIADLRRSADASGRTP